MPLFMKRLLCMIFHVPLFTKPFSYVTPYVSVLMLYSIITAQLLMYHICTLVFYCYLQIILYFYTPPIFITVPPYHSYKIRVQTYLQTKLLHMPFSRKQRFSCDNSEKDSTPANLLQICSFIFPRILIKRIKRTYNHLKCKPSRIFRRHRFSLFKPCSNKTKASVKTK